MKQLFSAGIVVYRKRNDSVEYLLLRNTKGHWDFPKGEIEKGEDKITAALRELEEEAGITASIKEGFEHSFSYFFTDHDHQKAHKTVYFFIGEADVRRSPCGPKPRRRLIGEDGSGEANSTDVKLSHEHDDFAWLPLQEALGSLSFDEGKELLRQAAGFVVAKKSA